MLFADGPPFFDNKSAPIHPDAERPRTDQPPVKEHVPPAPMPQATVQRGDEDAHAIKITVGSKVLLQRVWTGGKFEITLVKNQNDPDNGLVSVHAPLGKALINAVEGDYVEYPYGNGTHQVLVLWVQ